MIDRCVIKPCGITAICTPVDSNTRDVILPLNVVEDPVLQLSCISNAEFDELAADVILPQYVLFDEDARLPYCDLLVKNLKTLRPTKWLDDEVINFYLELLVRRSSSDPDSPKVFCLTTFLYPKFISKERGGYQLVRRWTKKLDIFQADVILFPINLGNFHWALVSVNLKEKRVLYHDSFGTNNRYCLRKIHDYLLEEHQDKKGTPIDYTNFTFSVDRSAPRQSNGFDCGVFLLKYADCITRGMPLTFDKQDVTKFRKKIMFEILKGELTRD